MIEYIENNSNILGIIIRANYTNDGVKFFTPDNFSQQLAYMKHSKGCEIMPHIHNVVQRDIFYTQETLYIKKGKLRVDFYDNEKNYLKNVILDTGDIILLASGGHGMECLEDTEMVEIKQGPYLGDYDKVRFEKGR